MIRPLRCRFMIGATARHMRKVPLRFTSWLRSQTSSDKVSMEPPGATPALLTRTSMRPWAATIAPTTSVMRAASRTSQRWCSPRQPLALHSALSASRYSGRTSVTTVMAPSPASVVAISRPMPRPAPVTRATLPWRSMSIGILLDPCGRCASERGAERREGRGPADDAVLGADHVQRGPLELGEIALGGVLHQEALEAAIVGLAHGALHADLGGDSGEDEVGHRRLPQQVPQRGGVEGPLAGLEDDGLTRQRRQVRHDVIARLAVDQDAAHGPGVADAHRRASAAALGGRTVGEIGAMSLARVQHAEAVGPTPGEELPHRGHDGGEPAHVVAEGLPEAAPLDEVALHVDDDQGRRRGLEGERIGPGGHLGHGLSYW